MRLWLNLNEGKTKKADHDEDDDDNDDDDDDDDDEIDVGPFACRQYIYIGVFGSLIEYGTPHLGFQI